MNVKCEYCGAIISENDEKCYRCGTVNQYWQRKNKKPHTIEELKDWCMYQNLPNETITRFFIGVDYKFPEAYGIYRDVATGIIVIYENKLGGERVIHYSGKDEVYAVEKYFEKLKATTSDPKERKKYAKTVAKSAMRREITWKELCVFIIVALMIIIAFNSGGFLGKKGYAPQKGYYVYDNECYYYESGFWFEYGDDSGWEEIDAPKELKKDHKDYFESAIYDSSLKVQNFNDSGYYITTSGKREKKKSSWNSEEWDINELMNSTKTDKKE